ncbi:caspase activity and apoptosis inhibitor 1-like [Uloborus diversus]|uniref:caspase activity and apoptosis inhibitor 1-like n=1 Tax=Uloborus diversus TaxID=327109 RepID=UPI00240979C1|nr:caspase activity and apoptosis inhibitor 1-like [Uloborus diversus]XP_054706133.1 caspase activity and apoptosis inhibitor 1-like [Uloborus diversus]XP_054706134.1 caspase activity and apoptosis inhibitor 1-like [Uloborus diversus]XP_054706135.1 caspase activity and apoptosis inhibitor 1-like [Uloborus diversus]XP_054706136.1 caspase activity and apoptosis inhibitor 1-like [Uloborus diversus]XP_054706137.1 caspase activity and apoptosis inhibitor 1-like [Uloborus diversus]XP_054706138.1 ca
MKSSKSSESSKRKRRETSIEKSKTKRSRVRSRSNSLEKDRKVQTDSKNVSRKTRWHDKASESKEVVQPSDDKGSPQIVPLQKLEDMLDDKERIVEHIFATLPAPAFQEIIPDYLKKYSKSELKRLCIEQIKDMSKDYILQLISGKEVKCSEDIKTELSTDGKSDNKGSIKVEKIDKSITTAPKDDMTKSPPNVSCHGSDSSSRDVLELFATSNEMEDLIEDENKKADNKQTDEESKLQNEAELLELEMRARAIRSLLRAKNLSNAENVDEDKQEGQDDE